MTKDTSPVVNIKTMDMLGRPEVVTVDEARGMLLSQFNPVPPPKIEMPIDDCLGRVTAIDVLSPEDLPNFSRSTVDGFAVAASDTFGATEAIPAYLNIAAEVIMGKEPVFELRKGEVARIATGGMLPIGSDAVVMLEHTQAINEKIIEVLRPVAPGDNVIQAGEDAKKGDLILSKGHRIRPQDIGALAGLGITSIPVYEKPRVVIISTGDEVVPASSPIKTGEVRDINSYNLAGLITKRGGVPIRKGILPDRYDVIKAVLKQSLKEADIVTITGGSSVGARDLTAKIINDLGSPGVLFHGVSVKPGKPMIGGIVDGKAVFGLPGHPAAVTVCFELFIRPVLELLTGEKKKHYRHGNNTVKARLTKNLASSSGREEHIRVAIEERDGKLWAKPILGKSGLITTLVKADGTIVIPLRKLGLDEGEEVEVILFD